jgi:TorA maturation chaperone TorD
MARWLSGAIAGVVSPVEEPLPDPLGNGALAKVLATAESVETERVRLFVNAPEGIPLPPYGSWWMEGTLQGESTERVAEFYRQEGLQHASSAGPADYLPAELEFLHFLLQHQLAAKVTGSESLERQGREREREFLERFLLPWLPSFCAEGKRATSNPLWLALFDLLLAFVEKEAVSSGARARD